MAVAAALTLSAAVTVVVAVVSKIRISLTWYVTRALLRCLANHFSCCIATASAGSGACQGSLFSPACLDLRTVVLLALRQSGLLTLPSPAAAAAASAVARSSVRGGRIRGVRFRGRVGLPRGPLSAAPPAAASGCPAEGP